MTAADHPSSPLPGRHLDHFPVRWVCWIDRRPEVFSYAAYSGVSPYVREPRVYKVDVRILPHEDENAVRYHHAYAWHRLKKAVFGDHPRPPEDP